MAVYWHPFEDGFAQVLLALWREHRVVEDDFCRWREALSAFRGPALTIWGDRDPTFRTHRAYSIAGLLADAHVEVFEHSNHFVPEDRPEALGRLIDVFLEGRYLR
jgi:pimeloyl-ACP methyl ester carboxylesterase